MADMLPDDTNSKQLAQYQQTVRELQAVLAAKLDRATHEVLLRATDLQDAETFNLQRVFRSEDEQHTVALCLWGNLTPNTRYASTLFSLSLSCSAQSTWRIDRRCARSIKSHEFVEKNMSFEVSRFLALSNCAVRALFTRFDHLSPRCFSYRPRLKPPSPGALLCTVIRTPHTVPNNLAKNTIYQCSRCVCRGSAKEGRRGGGRGGGEGAQRGGARGRRAALGRSIGSQCRGSGRAERGRGTSPSAVHVLLCGLELTHITSCMWM